jgi:hypothetical protein
MVVPPLVGDWPASHRASAVHSSVAAEALFDSMRAAFARARRAHARAPFERSYRLSGRLARVRVLGRELAERIDAPLAHLHSAGTATEPATLAIDLWDESETGVACPAPSPGENFSARRIDVDEVAAISPDRRFAVIRAPGSVTWLDRQAQHLIGWRASAQELSMHERAKPLVELLSIWCNDQDVQVVHAGLVAWRGRGILIAGRSGAGKSTLALAALLGGFDYLADDQSGLAERADGSFVGHSLFASARLERGALFRFPRLQGDAIEDVGRADTKALMFLPQLAFARLATQTPLEMVVLPRITGRVSLARSASEGEALLQLAPSSLITAVSPGRRGLERMARLVQSVPRYWIEIGRVEELPELLRDLLSRGAAR